MKKINSKLILILLALLGSASCDSRTAQQNSALDKTAPAKIEPQTVSKFPVTVKDSEGIETSIAQEPVRIISLLPSHTEILFAIGAGEQMAGCTTNCDYPEETQNLKKVSLSNPGSINLETLVALKPDLVLLGGDYHQRIREQLSKLKIPVLSFESQSLAEIERSIRGMSRSTGHVDAGEKLIQKLQQEVASIQEKIKPYQKEGRPRVFYQVWDQPLMTAGPTSFIGELIDLAGGENIFDDVDLPYPQVSEEILIQRNPDVILLPRSKKDHSDATEIVKKLSEQSGWKQMKAVKNQRIYLIEEDFISRPGPRVVQGLEKVAQALYPEAFQK